MIDLPGYTKEGLPALQKRCEELAVQPRETRLVASMVSVCKKAYVSFFGRDGPIRRLRSGNVKIWTRWSGPFIRYDFSFSHCTSIQVAPLTSPISTDLATRMIDGVNTLWKEDKALQKKHGI